MLIDSNASKGQTLVVNTWNYGSNLLGSPFNILAHFGQNKMQLLIDSNVNKFLTFVVNTWNYGSNLIEPKHKYLSSIIFHFFFLLLCTFFQVSCSFYIGIFCRPISMIGMSLSLKRKIHKIIGPSQRGKQRDSVSKC